MYIYICMCIYMYVYIYIHFLAAHMYNFKDIHTCTASTAIRPSALEVRRVSHSASSRVLAATGSS